MPQSRPTWGEPCKTAGGFKRIEFSNGTAVTVAAGIAELVRRLGNETIRRGYEIRSGVTGSYNCRHISGTNSYSNHAWGLAIDINWDTNPWSSTLKTDMPDWMVELWTAYGFRWGGGYRKPDAMHYEYMGTRENADAHTRWAIATKLGEAPTVEEKPVEPSPGEYELGERVLQVAKPKMRGNDVHWVQETLKNQGLTITVDGWYGNESKSRVAQMQGWNDLVKDGIVGPKTWAVLKEY